MKNKKTYKQILTILLITLLLLIINSGKVNAGLQANKNTQYSKSDLPTNWIKNFREMEKTGQAMGLSEELEEDLTPKDNISNDIDVHMIRSTEYGAIAILSASGYGNPSNDNVITSTTGNNTGVILDINYFEAVGGGRVNLAFQGMNTKYYDTYTSDINSARVGDAFGNNQTNNKGCLGWHMARNSIMLDASGYNHYMLRGQGGIFSFSHTNYGGISSSTGFARGVAVCGKGI